MKFPPIYCLTPQIEELLRKLDILKAAYELVAPPPKVVEYLRKKSILKSSLYSARIEGNPLTLEDIQSSSLSQSTSLRKKEVVNIMSAIGLLDRSVSNRIDLSFILKLHSQVMSGISPLAGYLRSEESAIFNQAGVVVYLAPAPSSIKNLLIKLFYYGNTSQDPYPVRAAVAHLWFEKIHPFEDGNGRVGRLLSGAILKKGGWDFGGIVPIEEYIEAHRQEYYDELARDKQDVTSFVEFFLTALASQAKTSLEEMKKPVGPHRVELLPRRAEILDIIRDHEMVSFDFLARRFRGVAPSTVHLDLQQLIKGGYIKKLGSTRGAVYVPSETP